MCAAEVGPVETAGVAGCVVVLVLVAPEGVGSEKDPAGQMEGGAGGCPDGTAGVTECGFRP